jgi:hypothetical protein
MTDDDFISLEQVFYRISPGLFKERELRMRLKKCKLDIKVLGRTSLSHELKPISELEERDAKDWVFDMFLQDYYIKKTDEEKMKKTLSGENWLLGASNG